MMTVGVPTCNAYRCVYNRVRMNDAKYTRLPEESHHRRTYTLTFDVTEYLRTRRNKSATVDSAVRASKDFRAWQRERKGGTQPQLI